MVMVQHGSHTIKTEAIEMVLSHPELQIGQQEMDNFGFTVVKALGAPSGMIALVA